MRPFLVFAPLTILVLAGSCTSTPQQPPAQPQAQQRTPQENTPPTAKNDAYKPVAADAGDALVPGKTGTIRGHVRLMGQLPGNPIIRMGMDPKCAETNAGKRIIQEYVLAARDGSLANTFVRLKGKFPKTAIPSQPALIEQRACVYAPRVIGVQVGQTVQIRNDDDLMHNIDASSAIGNGFNFAQPHQGLVYQFQPKQEEVMLHLKCDIHNWMNAYIAVVTNPYFAVSDKTGDFEIRNVPAGTYTIEAWQEIYGSTSRQVTVKAGGATAVDFTYMSTGQLPSPPSHRRL